MLVKVTLSGIVDTENQDKFLREALENLITGDGDLEHNTKLVASTFRARFCEANLGVSLVRK